MTSVATLTGCATYGQDKYVLWSNADHIRYIGMLPFQGNHPIAREIRFTHTQIIEYDGLEWSRYSTADEETVSAAELNHRIPTLHSIEGSSSSSRSTQFRYHEAQAEIASEAGDRAMALHHRDMAIATNKFEGEEAKIMSGRELVASLVGGAHASSERVDEDVVDREASLRAAWIAEGTGAIGPEAHEGSTLHLNSYRRLEAKKFHVHSLTEFSVVAILDDGRGRIVRSQASYPVVKQLDDSDAPDLAGGSVPVEPTIIPKEPQELIPEYLREDEVFLHLVILANAAVAELYGELASQ